MIDSRRLNYVFGAFTAVLGIVLLLSPETATGLTTSDTVVLLLGIIALGQAALVITRQTSTEPAIFQPPECRSGIRTPGHDYDSQLDGLDSTLREEIKSSVIATLARFQIDSGYNTSAGHQQLQRGTWTENPKAAAFFSSTVELRGLYRPQWLGGEPLIRKQVRASISALSTLMSDHIQGFDSVEPRDLRQDRKTSGTASDTGMNTREEISEPDKYTTFHWDGIGAIALFTIAIAILAQRPPLLLVGAVGVALTGYSAYGRVGSFRDIDLTVERHISTNAPVRGDDVTVHVRVRNESETVLPDVRLVDGVPPELVVADGSPRQSATLPPGHETTFTYSITAEFGEHTFEPMFVLLKDVTGERAQVMSIGGEDLSLTCHPPPEVLEAVSVRDLTTGYPGQLTADEGGQGVQFHDTRQYQPGDPISLIDWKSLARTGDLTTLRFEEEQMANVMVMVDARSESNVSPSQSSRSAIARSVEAADVLVTSLLEENHIVGVTALSPNQCWLQPGRGTEHSARARQFLMTHPAFDTTSAAEEYFVLNQLNWFLQNLAATSQAILLTPLCDDLLVTFIKRLQATGTPITVISPDPTTRETPGELLAQIDRHLRIAELRDAQVPVHEWHRDESLALALERGKVVNA